MTSQTISRLETQKPAENAGIQFVFERFWRNYATKSFTSLANFLNSTREKFGKSDKTSAVKTYSCFRRGFL